MALPVRHQQTESTRWDPFAEVQRLGSELSRFFKGWDEGASLRGDGFVPLADVEETDDAYLVELELPGAIDEDGVSATLDDGVLTVRVPTCSQPEVRSRTEGATVIPGGCTKAASDQPRHIQVT